MNDLDRFRQAYQQYQSGSKEISFSELLKMANKAALLDWKFVDSCMASFKMSKSK